MTWLVVVLVVARLGVGLVRRRENALPVVLPGTAHDTDEELRGARAAGPVVDDLAG